MIDPLKSYPTGGFGLFRKKDAVLPSVRGEEVLASGEQAAAYFSLRGLAFVRHAVLEMVTVVSLRLRLRRSHGSLPQARRSSRSAR